MSFLICSCPVGGRIGDGLAGSPSQNMVRAFPAQQAVPLYWGKGQVLSCWHRSPENGSKLALFPWVLALLFLALGPLPKGISAWTRAGTEAWHAFWVWFLVGLAAISVTATPNMASDATSSLSYLVLTADFPLAAAAPYSSTAAVASEASITAESLRCLRSCQKLAQSVLCSLWFTLSTLFQEKASMCVLPHGPNLNFLALLLVSTSLQLAKGIHLPWVLDSISGEPNICLKLLISQGGSLPA